MSAEDRAFDAWQEQGETYQRSSERGAWEDMQPSIPLFCTEAHHATGPGHDSECECWCHGTGDEVQLLRKVSPTSVELTCSICGSWYAIVLSDAEDGGGSQDGIFRHYLSEHPESVQASAIRQWLEEE